MTNRTYLTFHGIAAGLAAIPHHSPPRGTSSRSPPARVRARGVPLVRAVSCWDNDVRRSAEAVN